jgi:hypothetical protein
MIYGKDIYSEILKLRSAINWVDTQLADNCLPALVRECLNEQATILVLKKNRIENTFYHSSDDK